MQCPTDHRLGKTQLFLYRYTFQTTLYSLWSRPAFFFCKLRADLLWREGNNKNHCELPLTTTKLIQLVDKIVRNRVSFFRDMGSLTRGRSTHTIVGQLTPLKSYNLTIRTLYNIECTQ